MAPSERCIIAVAGSIGSGKSTLVRELAAALGGAATLHFDDYEHLTEQTAHDLAAWLQRGADFNEFQVPGLVEDLRRLKLGHTPASPFIHGLDAATRFIIFEGPLGREHAATAPFLDLVLWLDTPPEIALARKLRDFAAALAQRGDAREGLHWIAGFLDNYLSAVRSVLAVQRERVSARADFILDGETPAPALAREAAAIIRARFS
jgi:uridine kinase